MFERVRNLLLRWLRVPPEPQAPFGAAASVRVFRASRKLYLLRLVRWGVAQIAALMGIVFWLSVIMLSEREALRVRSNPAAHSLRNLPAGRNQVTLGALQHVPTWLFSGLWALHGLGLLIYVAQLVFTYAALRLDYELRWYIVTDRSLRLRWGLWRVQEMTMSFANLQQVVVFQGPLERLLGIANVRVDSAGGGASASDGHEAKTQSMHTGIFHGVEKAEEIRDLVLQRLRSFRETGLGDPDEHHTRPRTTSAPLIPAASRAALLAAGRELLSEVRQLRAVVDR